MSYPSYGSDERSSLLQKVQTKDDFSSKKFRCMTHPTRAFETLSPYAVLEVGVMTARDLTERESGFFNTDTTPDAFVQLILDDLELEKCTTPIARRKKEPLWMYHCEVEVLAPMSMLRFQVRDDRATEKADIGFFDVCIGDIPYDKPIEGWCELRFQESLKNTSPERYANHCTVREETRTELTFQEKKEAEQKDQEIASNVTTQIPEDDKETKLVVKRQWYTSSKDRTMDAFQACVHSTAEKAEEFGFDTLSKTLREGGRKRRSNAGEVFVSLRLRLLVGSSTSAFAYALEPPAPMNHGSIQADVKLTGKIDLQRCVDDIWEVKVCVVDDALLCCVYGFRYLVTWRSVPLSLLYLTGLLLCCVKTYLTWAVIPLLLAISLIINSFPEARKYMTRGGLNAALTEEGFKHTASWRDSGEVMKFVDRLLKQDMKATLDDPHDRIRAFASQCVRDGVPTVNLEQLRMALTAADFVEEGRQAFARGDLVWVDGRFPAKVETVDKPDLVRVSYQKTLVLEDKPPENVRARQLVLRADNMKAIPPVPASFHGMAIKALYPIIEDLRHASLPAINVLTQILTWKKAGITIGIVVVLLIISALFTWAAVLHELDWENKGDLTRGQEVAIAVLRSLDNVICGLVVVAIFLLQASWLTSIFSFFKIVGRCGRSRPAPSHWAFFTEDSEQANFLRSQLAKNAQEHPHGMYYLPHMSSDAGSASATYAANHSTNHA